MNAHDIEFTSLSGGSLALNQFKGRSVLVVNVASACGLTPQYGPLQKMAEEFGETGPAIIGVPCNDFGGQEPGSAETIGAFCETKFGVTFPMADKVAILDKSARHPFYQWVAEQLGEEAMPKWNFHKYVIGPNGDLIASIGSRTAPDDVQVRTALGV